MSTKLRAFNANELHPAARDIFATMTHRLEEGWKNGHTLTWFKPFEGYRSPERQDALFKEGTTRAKRFQSGHQYGLCVDFVPWLPDDQQWSWDLTHDWKYLREVANGLGLLTPLKWDLPHVEHPIWFQVRKALDK